MRQHDPHYRRLSWLTFAAILLCTIPRPATAASITPLTYLSGAPFGGLPRAVSSQGRVVVGYGPTAQVRTEQPYFWTQQQGIVFIDTGVYGTAGSSNSGGNSANGVSADGNTIVGSVAGPDNGPDHAFRWTEQSGLQRLGSLPTNRKSAARDVSFDGRVIVGSVNDESDNQEGFFWRTNGTTEELTRLPGMTPTGVSGDGQVVTGVFYSDATRSVPFRWTSADGMSILNMSQIGLWLGQGNAVSEDGSVIVGAGNLPAPNINKGRAFRWRSDGTASLLPSPNPFDDIIVAKDVSADGSRIVGNSSSGPLYWDPDGPHLLRDALIGAGVDLTGWGLGTLDAISPDGRFAVGLGSNTVGSSVYLVELPAPVPEPNTLLLMFSGFVILLLSSTTRSRWPARN